MDSRSYEDGADGHIYTRTVLRVEEVFKGKLPPLVALVHRGGTLADRGEIEGLTPQFTAGEERLMFVSRRADGTLFALRGRAGALRLPSAPAKSASAQYAGGQDVLDDLRSQTSGGPLPGADLTDQATGAETPVPEGSSGPTPMVTPSSSATNLLVGSDGIAGRFLLPDQANPIPYYIDADYLPAGITQTQAITAVQTALAAWTNATSLRYRFAGLQSFGQAAPNVTNTDGALRIQLHDHYNYLAGGGLNGDVLGAGGRAWSILNLSAGWTLGGNVAGNDFHKAVRGYVVLQHTNVMMQTLSTFTEVLCHEIGHTIGLAHSSESANESNPTLSQAIMYCMAHADGRGAQLNSFDTNTSRQVHPPTNIPPFCFDRCMDIVTSPTRPLNVPGVNTVQVRGYSLQNSALTLATTGATANNGAFSVSHSNLTYVPSGFYSDSQRLDPAGNQYYDMVYARYSDGRNASPFASIRVISFYADSYNEGIPDSWRLSYFGNVNPAVGSKHHASDDADGDGYSNLEEYRLGSNPTNRTSNLRVTSFQPSCLQWQAKGYEVYEILSSTNCRSWTRTISPVVPTNATGTVAGLSNGSAFQLFRVEKVP
ncbi:MAG TPA: matrixin family metalloprotease [Candidatus Acidoferrum sp.]|nr:matrixin family metalloprotease [Candidatus Acidoferrum sp.]